MAESANSIEMKGDQIHQQKRNTGSLESRKGSEGRACHPSMFVAFFLLICVSSIIVTYFAWSTTYFASRTGTRTLSDSAVAYSVIGTGAKVADLLKSVEMEVDNLAEDIRLGFIFKPNDTSQTDREKTFRRMVTAVNVLLRSQGERVISNNKPWVKGLGFGDMTCPIGTEVRASSCRLNRYDNIEEFQTDASPFAYLPLFSLAGSEITCGQYVLYGRLSNGDVDWSSPFFTIPCLNSTTYPPISMFSNMPGGLMIERSGWEGITLEPENATPFSAEINTNLLQTRYSRIMRFSDDPTRVVIVAAGIYLHQVAAHLRQLSLVQTTVGLSRIIREATTLVVDSDFRILVDSSNFVPLDWPPAHRSATDWAILPRLHVSKYSDKNVRDALVAAESKYKATIRSLKGFIIDRFASQNGTQIVGIQELNTTTNSTGGLPDWYVVQVVPESAFVSDLLEAERTSLIVWISLTLAIFVLTGIVTGFVVFPIRMIQSTLGFLEEMKIPEAREKLKKLHGYVQFSEIMSLQSRLFSVLSSLERFQALQRETVHRKDTTLSKIAHASHEIRNPLNGILGIAELGSNAVEAPVIAEYREQMRTIEMVGGTLVTVLNDMIDLGRIEQGKMTIQMRDTRIEEILKYIALLFKQKFAEKGLKLIVDVGDDVKPFQSDPQRLCQVLTNFISNALKFTDVGNVTIKVRLEAEDQQRDLRDSQQTVTGHQYDSVTPVTKYEHCSEEIAMEKLVPRYVRIDVIDAGIGIRAADLDKLFVPFSQVHLQSYHDKREAGSGIGLALSKRLVELMHGQIGVSSEFGKGSTFWCTIPFVETSSAETPLSFHFPPIPVTFSSDTSGSFTISQQHDVDSVNELQTPEEKQTAPGTATPAYLLETTTNLPETPEPLQMLPNSIVLRVSNGPPPLPAALVGRKFSRKAVVLVVDDSKVNRYVMSRLLKQIGVRVETACDGQQALNQINQRSFDLVLMDLQMPVMDGWKAVEKLRQPDFVLHHQSHLVVMACTGEVSETIDDQCHRSGFDGCLAKPVTSDHLRTALWHAGVALEEEEEE